MAIPAPEPGNLGQVIELDPEDAARLDAFAQKVLNQVELRGRLPDLTRSPQHNDRSQSLIQSSPHATHKVAPRGWKDLHLLPFPPRIEATQRRHKLRRKGEFRREGGGSHRPLLVLCPAV